MESVDEGKVRERQQQRPDAADAAAVKGLRKGKGKGKGKGKEKEQECEEFLGVKLRRGVLVGKKCGGAYTPPPTWSFPDEINRFPSPATATASSARQLGANLWEILPHLGSMERIEKGSSGGGAGSRRYQYVQHGSGGGGLKKKGLLIQPVLEEEEEEEVVDSDGGTAEQQPGSAGSSFHRQIAESLRRHHRSVVQNSRALQPVSPASFSSSMEVTPYNPAGSCSTPTSSMDPKTTTGNSRTHDLKTSTELLKVLNRIWSLEEQHASNISVVKTLKTELNNAHSIIKELLREKQVDRQVMDNLMKQLEQDRIKSVKQELEDERKLRKRSESLHRKLARELSEAKSAANKAVNELERERNGRVMLEELCDEFAMSVREYEQEVRSYRNEKGLVRDGSMILQVSEAWLDERMQMKMDDGGGSEEPGRRSMMVVEKLGSEIQAFVQARQQQQQQQQQQSVVNKSKKLEAKEHCFRRQSLESFPLNEAGSAPPNNLDGDEDDDDSVDSESNCFELSKMVPGDGLHGGDSSHRDSRGGGKKNIENGLAYNNTPEPIKRSVEPPREVKSGGGGGVGSGMSRMQARFEQHMARTILSNQMRPGTSTNPPAETMCTTTTATQRTTEETTKDSSRKSKRFGSMSLMGSILSNNSSSIEGEKIHPEDTLVVAAAAAGDEPHRHRHFMLAGSASPVKKWEPQMGRLREPKIMMESSSSSSTRMVGSRGVKENTLKAKLMEARLEGRNLYQAKGL